MKPTILLTVAALATSLLVSCNKSETAATAAKPEAAPATPKEKADALLAKLTGGMEKTVIALESVTDKASAETAAAKIREVSAELSTLAPQAQALEIELSEDDKKAMETSSMEKMKPIMDRMSAVMPKVMVIPEVGEILMPAIQEFQKSMAPPSNATN